MKKGRILRLHAIIFSVAEIQLNSLVLKINQVSQSTFF